MEIVVGSAMEPIECGIGQRQIPLLQRRRDAPVLAHYQESIGSICAGNDSLQHY